MAGTPMNEPGYKFTEDWFAPHIPLWNKLVPRYKPRKVLEIGSYEGRSACHLIETCAPGGAFEIHCVDSWQGGIEHDVTAMSAVEARFDHNTAVAIKQVKQPVKLVKHKSFSNIALARLLFIEGAGTFDVIYVDGSHQAPDVLTDAVMAFQLLRVGGLMIFDDYLWSMEGPGREDPLNMPKPAIDAFLNIFQRKMFVVRGAPLYQLFATKVAA